MTNPTEAPMANAIDDVKPVAWQRRLKFDTRNMNLPGRWEQCPGEEATGHFERRAGYEYRSLYASPSPSQHTGWSDEAVEALAMAEKRLVEFARAVDAGEAQGGAREWERRIWASFAEHRAALSAASSIAPATGFEVKENPFGAVRFTAIKAASEHSPSYVFADQGGGTGPLIEISHHADYLVDDARAAWVAKILDAAISPSVAKESGELIDALKACADNLASLGWFEAEQDARDVIAKYEAKP